MKERTVVASAVEDGLPPKSAEKVEEAVLANLIEEDIWRLSRESLTMRSWTGFRLVLVLFVMGCNQAAYGIDWAVISGINAYDSWHDFFGFGSSGGTYGLINALMNNGMVCGAPFLSLSDVVGHRGVTLLRKPRRYSRLSHAGERAKLEGIYGWPILHGLWRSISLELAIHG